MTLLRPSETHQLADSLSFYNDDGKTSFYDYLQIVIRTKFGGKSYLSPRTTAMVDIYMLFQFDFLCQVHAPGVNSRLSIFTVVNVASILLSIASVTVRRKAPPRFGARSGTILTLSESLKC